MTSPTRHLLASSSLGLLASILPAAAFAQSTETTAVQLSPVVVTDQAAAAANNTSSADREKLDQQGRGKVDSTLQSMPGVFTRENAQQPGVAVNIRGFEGSNRVNMEIDGVRQNFRFTGHEAGGFTYVDPNLLADIDVTRGQVTESGGGALAGMVNFRTLGVDDLVEPGKTFGGMTKLSVGSNGAGFQEMLGVGGKIGGLGVAAAIDGNTTGNYKDGNDAIVAHSGQKMKSGLVKVQEDIDKDQSVNLGGVFYNNDFYADSYYQNIRNSTVNAGYAYHPGSDYVDLVAHVNFNQLNMKYTGGTGSYVGRQIQDQGTGFDVKNTSHFDLGPVRLKSTNGVEYFHDSVNATAGGVNPGQGESQLLGVFSNNTFSYGIFDLTPGLRFDHYTLNGNGYLSNYGAYNVDTSVSSFDPKFTLDANVLPWLQPYVTWSRSMRSPTLQETMLGGDHPGSVSAGFVANPYLKPETSTGWEFGLNAHRNNAFFAGDTLSAKVDYFLMDVDDYIASTYLSAYKSYQFTNVSGTSHVHGAELQANYDLGYAFGTVAYTNTHSDLPPQLNGMGASQYLPENVASLTLGGRMLDRKLVFGANYEYVSGGLTTGYATVNKTLSAAKSSIAKDYNLVGLFAKYQVAENIEVNGQVTNLLNQAYMPFLDTTGNGMGRTFYVGTKIRF